MIYYVSIKQESEDTDEGRRYSSIWDSRWPEGSERKRVYKPPRMAMQEILNGAHSVINVYEVTPPSGRKTKQKKKIVCWLEG